MSQSETIQGLFPNARITSTFRTPQHNAAVGGVPNSDHLTGNAVDFVVPGMSTAQAAAQLKAAGVPARVILDEGNHVHWSLPHNGGAPMASAGGFDGSSIFGGAQSAPEHAAAQDPAGFDGSAIFADAKPAPTKNGAPGPMNPPRLDPALGIPAGGFPQQGQGSAIDIQDAQGNTYYGDPSRAPAGTPQGDMPGAMPGQQTLSDLVRGDGKTAGYRQARSFAEGLRKGAPHNPLTDFASTFTAPLQPAFDGLVANGVQKAINLGRDALGMPIKITGDEAGRAFADTDRAANAQYGQQHPVLSTAGTLLGGMAMAPGAAGAGVLPNLGKTVLGRLAMAGGIGAGEGAIAAAPGHRLGGAVAGGAGGLAGGALFEGLAPVAGKVISAVRGRFGPPDSAPRLTKAETQVAATIDRAVQRDTQAGIPMRQARPGQMPFETGGENLAGLAEGATQVPGAARSTGVGALTARHQNLSQMLLDGAHEITGMDPAATAGDVAQQAATGREAASPLYDEAYALGGVNDPAINSLVQRPSMQKALHNAVEIAREEGRNPSEMGFVVEKAPGGGTSSVQVKNPTVQTLDYVKRGLDDVIDEYRDTTTRRLNLNTQGHAIVRTAGSFRNALIEATGGAEGPYARALAAGGDPIRREQAFKDGPQLLSKNVPERVFNARVAQMGDADRASLLGGWTNKLYELARAGRLRPKMYTDDALQAKIATLIGPEKAGQLIDHIEGVAAMQDRTNQVLGNSRTAFRTAARDDLAADPTRDMQDTLIDGATLNVRGLAGKAAKAALKAVPRKDRSVIGNPETNDLLGKALFGEGGDMSRLLNLLEAHRQQQIGRGAPYMVGVPAAAGGLLSGKVARQ